MALHFNCNPLELDEEQILDYLYHIKTQSRTPSSSYFKHTVYGLRFAYRAMGMQEKQVFLPKMQFPKKLPVVLSQREVKLLLKSPALLKHRLVLALLYGCGLRRQELCNPKFIGAAPGMIAILHTWRQNLSLHPHLHCIVPGGGITTPGKWKAARGKNKFLFPVKVMSKVFRAKYVLALRKEGIEDAQLYKSLFSKPWVVYCKQPFFGPQQVVEYLGRYTHKIAISNHRIRSIENGKVTFTAKDYRKGGKKYPLTLSEDEFIRRFAMHILPRGFTRIRHYGILSSTLKKVCVELLQQELGKPDLPQRTNVHLLCPVCRKGKLVTIWRFHQRGPPPMNDSFRNLLINLVKKS